MDFLSRVCLLCLVLLASEVTAFTTSFNLSDFSSASQAAVGGLTFNGAATSDGTLNTNVNAKAAGNFFFNQQINATSFPSFSAFYNVSYDTSNCQYGYCNDGVALILQTVGLNFYSSSATWSIPQETGSFAVGFLNFQKEYEVDDGNETYGRLDTYYNIYSQNATDNIYTWVDYNHGTLQLDVYLSLINIKSSATRIISKSGVNIFGSSDLNLPSFGTYYVGLGASTGMAESSPGGYSGYPSNEGHQVISMWFNTCLDCNAPCGAPTGDTVTTCPPPIADFPLITSFSTPFDASFPAYALNGDAVLLSNNLVQLTSQTNFQASSVYIKAGISVINSFSMFVQVAITCNSSLADAEYIYCADGFAINFQATNPLLVGLGGGDIGILDQSTAFYSVGFEAYDQNMLSLYVHPVGGSAAPVQQATLNLADANTATINVWIDYNPSSSSPFVVFSSYQAVSNPTKPTTSTFSSVSTLYSVLDSALAYVGISAGTGGSNQQQVINSWIFCSDGETLNSTDLICISPTPTPTPTSTSTATPTLIATATGSSTQSSLSGGAIAGIVIGVLLCLIFVIIIIIALFLVRRQNKKQIFVAESSMLEMSMPPHQGTMTSLSSETRTSFTDRTAHLHHSEIVSARRPGDTRDELNNYMDDMKKEQQSHGVNDTIMNTMNEVSLPGFLFMSMNQLQVFDVVGGGGNGLIKRATVVDPAWKKENPKFGEVAIKFVPGALNNAEQNALNFQQEVAAMNALRFHQNIAALLGFCESPRAIILPLYQGDLHGYLHLSGSFKTRPFPWTAFAMLDIATEIAAAIMSMHILNIVHRDIKPKNVLLEAIKTTTSLSGFPFRARVCDFGIARIVDNEYYHDVKVMGSVNVFGLSTQYAAPEVFSHMHLASKGSFIDPEEEKKGDIYAFAITLWECLTEKIPYRGIGNDEINKMVIGGDRPELPEASDVADGNAEGIIRNTLADIIRSCWQQMANSRLDARKLVAQLEKLQQTLIRQSTGDHNGVLDQC